jgi:hypothetical protein
METAPLECSSSFEEMKRAEGHVLFELWQLLFPISL